MIKHDLVVYEHCPHSSGKIQSKKTKKERHGSYMEGVDPCSSIELRSFMNHARAACFKL